MKRTKDHNAGPLVSRIRAKAAAENMTVAQLAKAIDCGATYTAALLNGNRKITMSCEGFLRGASRFLGIPYIQTLALAGLVNSEDFLAEEGRDAKLRVMYQAVLADPVWTGLAPSEEVFNALPADLRTFILLVHAGVHRHGTGQDTEG